MIPSSKVLKSFNNILLNINKLSYNTKRTYFKINSQQILDYEKKYDYKLENNLPIIMKLDGNSFSKLSKDLNLNLPHDDKFHYAMKETSKLLFDYIHFSKFLYSFSDEINLLMFTTKNKSFLSNRIQKLVSIPSSLVSVNFSYALSKLLSQQDVRAYFDCRVFTLPESEVHNYFTLRQSRCFSNSLQSIITSLNETNHFNEYLDHYKNTYKNNEYIGDNQVAVNFLEKELNFDLNNYASHFKKGFTISRYEGEDNICSTTSIINENPIQFKEEPNYFIKYLK